MSYKCLTISTTGKMKKKKTTKSSKKKLKNLKLKQIRKSSSYRKRKNSLQRKLLTPKLREKLRRKPSKAKIIRAQVMKRPLLILWLWSQKVIQLRKELWQISLPSIRKFKRLILKSVSIQMMRWKSLILRLELERIRKRTRLIKNFSLRLLDGVFNRMTVKTAVTSSTATPSVTKPPNKSST